MCLYLRVAQENKYLLKTVGFCLGKEVKEMFCDVMMKGICGQAERSSTNIMEVRVQRGRSYQDSAEHYREKIPGGERWQERLVLMVVTEINRDESLRDLFS